MARRLGAAPSIAGFGLLSRRALKNRRCQSAEPRKSIEPAYTAGVRRACCVVWKRTNLKWLDADDPELPGWAVAEMLAQSQGQCRSPLRSLSCHGPGRLVPLGILLSHFGWPKEAASVEVVGRLLFGSTKFIRISRRRSVVSTGISCLCLAWTLMPVSSVGELSGLPRFQYTITKKDASGIPDTS